MSNFNYFELNTYGFKAIKNVNRIILLEISGGEKGNTYSISELYFLQKVENHLSLTTENLKNSTITLETLPVSAELE